jgi:T-complex protein 1 subunit eta
MVVDAVLLLDQGGAGAAREPGDAVLLGGLGGALDVRLVGIKKVTGGSVTDSHLVEGVAFKKTFSYAGFEQQPKHLKNPSVLLLNVELELKSEKENAEVRITDPDQYQVL